MSDKQDRPTRHLPVRPNLDQLKQQAKDLLRAIRSGDPDAIEEFRRSHPKGDLLAEALPTNKIKLADAQLALARSYQAPTWQRLVQACKLIDAIWRDDVETVRQLILKHPKMLHEHATVRDSNWGPPMTYAANLGRDRIIKMLYELGATDLESAIDRAVLQSKIDTARMLREMGALARFDGRPPEDALGGPAYTLSASGTALIFELGGRAIDEHVTSSRQST